MHAAELFTTAASGTAHVYNRNIDWKLFWRLVPFGILGGLAGTYVLTSFDGEMIRPFVAIYLSIIGAYLIWRSFTHRPSRPVNGQPRYVIGTVNTAEFLISLSVSLAFLFALLTGHWEEAEGFGTYLTAVLGLIAGGVIAAPLAGYFVRVVSPDTLLRIVGVLIIILGITQMWVLFGR